MIDSLRTGEEGNADPPEMSRFLHFFPGRMSQAMTGHLFNSLIQLHCSIKRHAQINPTVCEMQVGGGTCKRADGFFF